MNLNFVEFVHQWYPVVGFMRITLDFVFCFRNKFICCYQLTRIAKYQKKGLRKSHQLQRDGSCFTFFFFGISFTAASSFCSTLVEISFDLHKISSPNPWSVTNGPKHLKVAKYHCWTLATHRIQWFVFHGRSGFNVFHNILWLWPSLDIFF